MNAIKPIVDSKSFVEACTLLGFDPVYPLGTSEFHLRKTIPKGRITVERAANRGTHEARHMFQVSFNMHESLGTDFSFENVAMHQFLSDEGQFVFAYARILSLINEYRP